VIEVDIPKPREVTSNAFIELQRSLLTSLNEEVKKMMELSDGSV
jgi:hypothetical protein